MSKTCKIPDCNNPSYVKGWCRPHYRRWYRYGDPLMGGTHIGAPHKLLKDLESLEVAECVFWPYYRHDFGYGMINIKGKPRRVHRILCEKANGKPPSKRHEAAHICGNGHLGCVNKNHVLWKTPSENAQDKFTHGTHPLGEDTVYHKLTKNQVRSIPELRKTLTQQAVGDLFGVSRQAIQQIEYGKNWAWLDC